jgi:hypothetical protein
MVNVVNRESSIVNGSFVVEEAVFGLKSEVVSRKSKAGASVVGDLLSVIVSSHRLASRS